MITRRMVAESTIREIVAQRSQAPPIKAPMRKQGENVASIRSILGPVVDAARIHPRLAPWGFHEEPDRPGARSASETTAASGESPSQEIHSGGSCKHPRDGRGKHAAWASLKRREVDLY